MKKQSIFSITLMAMGGSLFFNTALMGATEADTRIESSAKQSHIFKTYLKDDAIKATSLNGVVTLTGTVNEVSHISLAQDTVLGLPEVTSVINQLKVKSESTADHTDQWLSRKVKMALLFQRKGDFAETDVTSDAGIVTLRGEVSNQAQKELATECARDVKGVKGVKNELTVTKNPAQQGRTLDEKIDDASITAQIKWSLLVHRSTSALKTTVGTKDGVVTISGIANNASEKVLVTKLVSDISGVNSVVNNMTVAASKN